MRCPKCHYLSFEPEPRCRNCGFHLETHDADPLMADADPVIKDRDAEGPLVDLDLRRPAPAEPRQPVSLGTMRPAREADRPSGYRPPAPRPAEPVESRPRPSAVGLEDRPRPQAPRPVATRPEPVRPSRPEFSRDDAPSGNAPVAPRVDVPRPRVEAPRVDAPRVDAPRVDAPGVVAPPAPPARVDLAAREIAKRAPQTTSDLRLFLKRLPDPEPEPAALASKVVEPKIETRIEPPIETRVETPIEARLDPPIKRPADAPIDPHLDPPIEPVIETFRKADPVAAEIDRPLVKVPQAPRAPLSVRRPAEVAKTKAGDPEITPKRSEPE